MMLRACRLLWALGAGLVLLNLSPAPVGAQLGIDPQTASGEPCECSPSCEGDVGGNSGTGCYGRVVPREDCPCCKVCAQGAGSPCAPPALPCDTQFGLVCSAESICEAALVCKSDRDCPNDHFCLGTACVDPCPILAPCEGAIQGGECFTKDHVAHCRCPDGTIKNSAGTNCIPSNGTEGCQHEGRLYAVDEILYNGDCQEQCHCGADGQFDCGPVICPTGLFLTGQHSKEELCIELRNRPETDECCVVVACANNLTHPSQLISPGSHRLGPISREDASFSGKLLPLSGRSVSQERPQPITEEEYQRRLKDLEDELNKDLKGKKPIGSKINFSHTEVEKDNHKATESSDSLQKGISPEVVSNVTEEPQFEDSTQLNDLSGLVTTMMPDVQKEDELLTTMMPDLQEENEEATTEKSMPAVIVELNEEGHEVHKITVGEEIEVVTMPIGEAESTTLAAEVDEMTTELIPTESTLMEEELGSVSAREGKMAPEDSILNNESSVIIKDKEETSGRSAAGGLKILSVSHNSTTLVLPTTKGGDIYYKSTDGTEWQRLGVDPGEDSFVVKGLQPKTEYTLKWSGESSGSAKITVQTEDGCIVDNLSYGVGQNWAIGCDERCSCRPGGRTNCQPRCLFVPGAVKDPLCSEKPAPEDPDCCVMYDCKKEDSTNPVILEDKRTPGQPKLLVTGETHNSVTLAWDDFRAKTHEGGYVVEYREEEEVNSAGPETPWMRKELPTGQLPKHTVDNLKPNTIYEVRVSIYDETDDSRPGESTETLTVRTKPGCLYKNESYVVGEFFIGCEERCMCLVNGDVKCFERCSIPYFRVNSFKDDPLCREVTEDGDECCVTVQCASGDSTVTEIDNSTRIINMTNDSCAQTVCGANAVCVSHTMNIDILNLSDDTPLIFGHCQCLDGFISKPSDPTSCIPDPTRNVKEGVCTFKSNSYQPGEVFYNECEYRCSCNNNTEIECEPRCEFTHKNGSKVEPGCEYKPDPEDSCCVLRVCNSTSTTLGDASRSPSLLSHGCTVDNITYAKDEKFYKGCETQCVCMGFGDVSCFPRCPPLKVVSDTPKHCQTLPDPEDSCCSITVCDEETPDVMKANITEMEKEMIMMKERMKNTTEMEKEMLMKRMTELEREMMSENISQLETVLRNMIEEKNLLINSNISDSEKEMLKKNMFEIEMMMKDVVEMERDITSKNLTDEEKETLKIKLTAMQRNLTDDLISEGKNDIDEHALLHLLGLDHSHDADEMKNHTHTHADGTTHTHPGGHLPHTHDDMENHTHTHENGTTHSHPGGHLPHTHDDDMKNHTHTHEDGTTHTHPGGHLPHTHDNMENNTHTHEDGTTHSHPDGQLPHTHDDMDNHTHTHEDGTTHSHPGGHLPHEHNDTENHNHTHGVDELHSHAHTHGDDNSHTHEDGTTHSHSHDHMSESRNETHHMHEDGSVHLHHDMPVNETHHVHEDGEVHMHHDKPGWKNETHHMHDNGDIHMHHDMPVNETHHMHEDGEVHMHHDMPVNETHHMHEDGEVHMHHDKPGWKNETHHMHDNGEVHMHHEMPVNETHHVHEDGQVHMHHDNAGWKNESHHMHEDGAVHMHHDMPVNETHHMHEDGEVHLHHDMPGWENETHHMHDDGAVHKHHDMMGKDDETDHLHSHTAFTPLEKKNRAEDFGTFDLTILNVTPVNSTSVVIRVGVSEAVLSQILINENQHLKVLYSPDSQTWMEKNVSVADIKVENMNEVLLQISDLEPSTPYQFRISYREHVSSTSKATLLDASNDPANFDADIDIDRSEMCSHNGRYYKRGQEFYEGCSRSCLCSSNLEVHCAEIECPITFGLQLIDPDCLEWDLDKNYTPTPPKCCPQVKCIQSSACEYMGQKFRNYDTIPRELTGCSQRCSCTYGNVTCIDECPPIPDFPPPELTCHPNDAIRVTLPGEMCCETWQCAAQSSNVDLIPRPHVVSLDPYTAQVMFATPNHYQGLPGELIIRYTSDPERQPNPDDWAREIIIPAGSPIGQSKWDYTLYNLEPSTQYSMQVMLTIRGADPVMSPVFSYNAPRAASTPPTTTPLSHLDINAELYAPEITKTSAKVTWRTFTPEELNYIDGIQLKYIATGKRMPKFSQMLHISNKEMELRDLQPGTEYTVDLVFIPHKNQTTEVSNTKPYVFETLPEEDKYAFEINIRGGNVTSQTAEVFYSGVSELEEKLVHVYKAVYLREEGNIEAEAFKIPKADEERKIVLNQLKPDAEYKVWLDAYLTNGRKKKSNVITIKTKAGQLPKPERSEVDPGTIDTQTTYSYYPALVAVAIIAAIAFLGFLGLLVILLRKQNHAKAHINSSRNNAAYDNPSYKVGDNGYDMEMNGIKGSGNGATHMEDP